MDEASYSVTTAASLAINRAGGARAVATALGIRREAVFQWKQRGIPPTRVQALAALSGLEPHILRPDIFSLPQSAEKEVA